MKIRKVGSALFLMVFLSLLAGCGSNPSSDDPNAERPLTPADSKVRAKAHTELAVVYLQNARINVALDELKIAISIDKNYFPAHNVMGLVYMELREDSLAQDSFDRALSLAPDDPDVNNNYGWFLCQRGQEEKSIKFFLTALKNPLYATPQKSYLNAGICLQKKNDYKGANEFFQKALKIDPDNPQTLLYLAKLHYKLDNLTEAKSYISKMNKLQEPSAEVLWLALRIERKLDDRISENNLAAELRKKFPGSKEYQALLKGQYE